MSVDVSPVNYSDSDSDIYIPSPDQSTLNQWPAHSDNVEYCAGHVLLQQYS